MIEEGEKSFVSNCLTLYYLCVCECVAVHSWSQWREGERERSKKNLLLLLPPRKEDQKVQLDLRSDALGHSVTLLRTFWDCSREDDRVPRFSGHPFPTFLRSPNLNERLRSKIVFSSQVCSTGTSSIIIKGRCLIKKVGSASKEAVAAPQRREMGRGRKKVIITQHNFFNPPAVCVGAAADSSKENLLHNDIRIS